MCACLSWASQGGTSGKEATCQYRRHRRHRFDPWVRKIPWRRARQPTPVFLPGDFHGQRSLAGYTVHGATGLDTTEHARIPAHSSTRQAFSNAVLWTFGPDASFCWRLHVDRGTTATSLVSTHWMPRLASPLGCGDPIHLQTLSHFPWGSKSLLVGTLYPHPSPCPPHVIL